MMQACHLCIFVLCLLLFTTATTSASADKAFSRQHSYAHSSEVEVDPDYIYNQLFYMVTHFQHREAGYDNNLPVTVNGHDEYGAYWTQEMIRNLQGFGPTARRDEFRVQGWVGRPATVPAFNMEVTVPGAVHPEQVVIIGCHYDGEAISNQSAYDDASGCAIELGVAKAMSEYWRNQHVYPARTLRFVIFDAEEQGLYGSFHYVNSNINGDLKNIVAMFNEEQNGIAYPLRYLGKADNPLLPFYVFLSPLHKNDLYPDQDRLSQEQKANISHFRALMQQAIPAVFAQFRAMGFQELTYHTNNGQDMPQPVFTTDQLQNVQAGDDVLGASDQMAFTMAGIPCVTMAGNFDTGPDGDPTLAHPGYPFDTSADTLQLMNTFADGSSQQSQALTLALALPGMITSWMLSQPDILGQIPVDSLSTGAPLAIISDVGPTVVNKSLALDGTASFALDGSALTYTWDFGDGTTAAGASVTHTYTKPGTYPLVLTISSAQGTGSTRKTLNVVIRAPQYANPYLSYRPTGIIHLDPSRALPTPDDSLSDKVLPRSLARSSQHQPTGVILTKPQGQNNSLPATLLLIAGVVAVLLVIGLLIGLRWRKSRV